MYRSCSGPKLHLEPSVWPGAGRTTDAARTLEILNRPWPITSILCLPSCENWVAKSPLTRNRSSELGSCEVRLVGWTLGVEAERSGREMRRGRASPSAIRSAGTLSSILISSMPISSSLYPPSSASNTVNPQCLVVYLSVPPHPSHPSHSTLSC